MLQQTDDFPVTFLHLYRAPYPLEGTVSGTDQSEEDTSKAWENQSIKGAVSWEKSHSAARTRTRNIKIKRELAKILILMPCQPTLLTGHGRQR